MNDKRQTKIKRRSFLKNCAGIVSSSMIAERWLESQQAKAAEAGEGGGAIVIDPKPLFEISPLLYMQFMEPLGVTDSSVEAAWDYNRNDWRADFVDATSELAPGALRFGGLFSRYYKWHEGVGPADKRPWMRNYVWGGKETNRVGTQEFVELCRRVGAEPLYCVNFESDGEKRYATMPEGNRSGDAREAADWVSYANDPDNAERKAHGVSAPYGIKLWQLGNETSYGGKNTFQKEQSIQTTIEFAKAMRERDKSIQLIGWGDSGWSEDLIEKAGEHIDFVAMHMMGQRPLRQDTVLRGNKYQAEPEVAWSELMELFPERVEKNLLRLEGELNNKKARHGIAITEGHLSLAPNNANPILTEWLTGVYHARALNLYQRHGDRVKICTAADFNGTRWTTNALIHQVPGGVSYLLPAGAVMRLFKRHNGTQGVLVKSQPPELDLAASRDGEKVLLHAANTSYTRTVEATFAVEQKRITKGRVFEIAPEDPRQEISALNPDVFKPREKEVVSTGIFKWRFPARSVSVVELNCS
jgi:alpha-L-arabinofuranosidase